MVFLRVHELHSGARYASGWRAEVGGGSGLTTACLRPKSALRRYTRDPSLRYRERARLSVALDDEMEVVGLDREVNDLERLRLLLVEHLPPRRECLLTTRPSPRASTGCPCTTRNVTRTGIALRCDGRTRCGTNPRFVWLLRDAQRRPEARRGSAARSSGSCRVNDATGGLRPAGISSI